MDTTAPSTASQEAFEQALHVLQRGGLREERLAPGAVREGLPYERVQRLVQGLSMTARQLAPLLGISERTLQRRKGQGRLRPEESDRFWRLEHVYRQAREAFDGDEVRARSWLTRSNDRLGGETPLEHLDTEVGTRAVEQMLAVIEHMMPA